MKLWESRIESLIDHVPDRHGHDQRYAINPAKANKELGWDPITTFEVGIKKTIEWYLSKKAPLDWMNVWNKTKSG